MTGKELHFHFFGADGFRGGNTLSSIWKRQPRKNGIADVEHSIEGGIVPEFENLVDSVRRVESNDLPYILKWSAHPDIKGHLDPAPRVPEGLPETWNNPDENLACIIELNDYYKNFGEDPNKITPLVAVDKENSPLAVLTIRRRGDPYVPVGRGIASVERFIVDPDLQGHGVGTKLLATALEYAFSSPYYGVSQDRPAVEVRAWTMEDEKAGDWRRNVNLMRKFGFQPIPDSNWPDYREKRGLPDDGRGNATWWKVKPDQYFARKEKDPTIRPTKINL